MLGLVYEYQKISFFDCCGLSAYLLAFSLSASQNLFRDKCSLTPGKLSTLPSNIDLSKCLARNRFSIFPLHDSIYFYSSFFHRCFYVWWQIRSGLTKLLKDSLLYFEIFGFSYSKLDSWTKAWQTLDSFLSVLVFASLKFLSNTLDADWHLDLRDWFSCSLLMFLALLEMHLYYFSIWVISI